MRRIGLLLLCTTMLLFNSGCEELADMINGESENEEEQFDDDDDYTQETGTVTLIDTTLPENCDVSPLRGSFTVTFEATSDWSISTKYPEYSDYGWLKPVPNYGSAGENVVEFRYDQQYELEMLRDVEFAIHCYSNNPPEGYDYEPDKSYIGYVRQVSGPISFEENSGRLQADGSITLSALEERLDIHVRASRWWSVETDSDWLNCEFFVDELIMEPGTENLILELEKNRTGADRTAKVKFFCEGMEDQYIELTVIQGTSSIIIPEDEYTFGNKAGEEIVIPFTGPDDTSLSYLSEDELFEYVLRFNEEGESSIIVKTLTDNTNPYSNRSSFWLQCEGERQEVEVIQKGLGLTLASDENMTIGYDDFKVYYINLTKDEIEDYTFEVEDGGDWLYVEKGYYRPPYYTIQLRADSANKSGEDRTTKITVKGGVEDIVVTVTQSCEGISMDDIKSEIGLTFAAVDKEISFTSNYDWTASLDDDAKDWVKIEGESSGTKGSNSLTLVIDENAEDKNRSCTFTITSNDVDYPIEITQRQLMSEDLSSESIPQSDVWTINDLFFVEDVENVRDALKAADDKGRQITIRLPYTMDIPRFLVSESTAFPPSYGAEITEGLNPENYRTNNSLVAIEAPQATMIETYALAGAAGLKSIDAPKVTSIKNNALYASGLTSVDMPKVTYIEREAFGACDKLTSAKFSSLESIWNNAFSGCKSLETIEIPMVNNMQSEAFSSCSSLSSIEIPLLKEMNVSCFSDCTSLRTASFDNVTNISHSVFYNCTSLESVKAPKLTSINFYGYAPGAKGAFEGCTSLKDIDLSNVTTIDLKTFSGCTSLSDIDLSSCVTISGNAFTGCTLLTSITAPKLTSINGEAFSGCTELTSIDAVMLESIYDEAFKGCTKITTLNIPMVERIGEKALYDCANFKDLTLPNLVEADYLALPSSVEKLYLPKIEKIYCSNSVKKLTAPSVTYIDDDEFKNYTNLETIVLHGVKECGKKAFEGCTSLRIVDMPRVEHISYGAFKGCTAIETMVLSLYNELTVTESASNSVAIGIVYAYPIFEDVKTSDIKLYIGEQESGSVNYQTNILDLNLAKGDNSYKMSKIFKGAPDDYDL